MPLRFYMDHHVPRSVALGLRLCHVDVLTAYEDHAHDMTDPDLLDRATHLGRVLFTQDDDMLVEAARRQRMGISFGGIVYAHQQDISIGQCVRELELIALAGTDADMVGQIVYIPL